MQFTLYEDENTLRRTGSSSGHNMTFMTDLGNVLNVDTTKSGNGSGNLSLDISPDAESISVDPDDSGGAVPELNFAIRGTTENQPSFKVKIKPQNLGEGSKFSAQIDPATGFFFFEDDDGNDVSYSVEIEKVKPDGKKTKFKNDDITLNGESAYVDFGTWDGEDIDLFVDEEGDGFADEEVKPIKNTANRIYLPLVTNE
ncbi:MAG: hypothetical protein AAGD96_27270 [Chloroflexota bacterium]